MGMRYGKGMYPSVLNFQVKIALFYAFLLWKTTRGQKLGTGGLIDPLGKDVECTGGVLKFRGS